MEENQNSLAQILNNLQSEYGIEIDDVKKLEAENIVNIIVPQVPLKKWVIELISETERIRQLQELPIEEVEFIIQTLEKLGFNNDFRPVVEYYFTKGNWKYRGNRPVCASDFFIYEHVDLNEELLQDQYVSKKLFQHTVNVIKDHYKTIALDFRYAVERAFNNHLFNQYSDKGILANLKTMTLLNIKLNTQIKSLKTEIEGKTNQVNRLSDKIYDLQEKLKQYKSPAAENNEINSEKTSLNPENIEVNL